LVETRERFWHKKMMHSSNEGWLRRASTALALVVVVAGIAIGGTGCSLLGSRPKPVVRETAPPPKPEPYVLLKLGERRVYWVDEASGARESFPVAIGRPKYPTPTGRFSVAEMVENPDFLKFDFANPTKKPFGRIPPGPNNPLGLRWIAFANAHGWTVGFHGTAKTSVLGQAVSHGCVRMSNPDVVKLYSRVKLGTPVIVEP
jgi:lipoprotein-anchoring transpeptidase ErfK/SrfK